MLGKDLCTSRLCGRVREVACQAALQCRELLHDDAVGELGRLAACVSALFAVLLCAV